MKKHIKLILIGTVTLFMLCGMSIKSNAVNVKITGDILNVREKPSTSSNVVARLSKNTECELLEDNDGWYKIKYKSYTGYISKKYAVKLEEDIKAEDENTKENQVDKEVENNEEKTAGTDSNIEYKVVNKDAELRILPLIYSSVIGNLKNGEEIVILTKTTGWSYIQTETISGWVRNDYLGETKNQKKEEPKQNSEEPKQNNDKPKEEKPTTNSKKEYKERKGYINEDFVNVRQGPSTDTKRVKVLALNNEITVIGEEGKWYKIKSGNDIGYIMKEFISDSKKTSSRNLTNPRIEVVPEKNNQEKSIEKIEQKNNDNNKNINTGVQVVDYSKKYLGVPYVYGGATPKGFDCSGFTMYVFKHFGINIPHGANSQYASGKGTKISRQSELKTGDLVFLTDYETGKGIGHCGIYIGNGDFIHASSTAKKVTISSLNTMYKGRFYSGLRIL